MPPTQKTARRSYGDFFKKCGCIQHNLFCNDENHSIYLSKHRLRYNALKELVKRNLFDSRSKYICSSCLQYSQENFIKRSAFSGDILITATESVEVGIEAENGGAYVANLPDEDSHTSNSEPERNGKTLNNEALSEILLLLKNLTGRYNSLPEQTKDVLVKISNMLGKLINYELFVDGQIASCKAKQLDVNQCLKAEDFLKEQNPILISFLFGCANVEQNKKISKQKQNAIVHAVEQVLYIRNLHTITPFAFKRNIV